MSKARSLFSLMRESRTKNQRLQLGMASIVGVPLMGLDPWGASAQRDGTTLSPVLQGTVSSGFLTAAR